MPKSMKRISFCLLTTTLVVSVLALLASGCGGGDAQRTETQQAPQEPTTDQEAAQSTTQTPTQSSERAAAGLIGTWQLTHQQGEPLPLNPEGHNGRVTFSEDGTAQVEAASSLHIPPLQLEYSVLDDSHIQFTNPENGESYVQEYQLEGDTLTVYMPGDEIPISQTWQ
jgi:glucose/arabinose dehydrogenase